MVTSQVCLFQEVVLCYQLLLISTSDFFGGYSVVNVVKVRSNQEEIESNRDIGGEIIESSVDKERDRTRYNVETKEKQK